MYSNQHKFHILVIPSWYPKYKGDISGSFFREQALALKKNGHEVGVIFPQLRSFKDIRGVFSKPYGFEGVNDDGLNTLKWHSLNFTPRLKSMNTARWVKFGIVLFEKYIETFGVPDVIHAHSLDRAGSLALYIKNKYQIPYVLTEHSSNYAMQSINKNKIKYLSKIVQKSSCNMAVSAKFSNILNESFDTNDWIYIPNLVNNDFLNYPLENKYSEFVFICVCNLNTNKSVDTLVKSFKIVSKQLPNVYLNIIGDGPEREKIIKLIEKLDLKRKVKVFGKLSRENVKLEVAKSKVFMITSKYETFGVVAVEALALGKPVIATKCGGPESIINKSVGVLVSVDSIDEIAAAMIQVYQNYDKYCAESIRDYCSRNFSEKAIALKLSNVYQNAIDGHLI